jgi:hypothetical protein
VLSKPIAGACARLAPFGFAGLRSVDRRRARDPHPQMHRTRIFSIGFPQASCRRGPPGALSPSLVRWSYARIRVVRPRQNRHPARDVNKDNVDVGSDRGLICPKLDPGTRSVMGMVAAKVRHVFSSISGTWRRVRVAVYDDVEHCWNWTELVEKVEQHANRSRLGIGRHVENIPTGSLIADRELS